MSNHGLLQINRNKTIIRGDSCRFGIEILCANLWLKSLGISLIIIYLFTFNFFAVKNNRHTLVLKKRIQKRMKKTRNKELQF